jgi:dCMP deaminase
MALNISNLVVTKNETVKEFLREAYIIAWENSKDLSTKVGSIIATPQNLYISHGYNHLIDGIEHIPEWNERPLKYDGTIHAEVDAITKAARSGHSLEGTTMYSPWFPCPNCYVAIKNSGIKKLIAHKDLVTSIPFSWEEKWNKTLFMANKGGFTIILYDGKIGGVKSLFDGKVWEP